VQFIQDTGGWTVSVPGYTRLRFEPIGDIIADELNERGFTVIKLGTTERCLSVAKKTVIKNGAGQTVMELQHPGIRQVSCYEVDIKQGKY
jgi:hypothetical protein